MLEKRNETKRSETRRDVTKGKEREMSMREIAREAPPNNDAQVREIRGKKRKTTARWGIA